MKRLGIKIGIAILPVLMLVLLFLPGQAEAIGQHSTTVMIYMCGSDLESRLGSASRDISEMLGSGFDEKYTTVLVMAGGSRSWKLGFDANHTTIAEIGSRGMRTVWRSDEPLNMAESSTLRTFLDYAYSHYESERHALILWDHGGGPNEGLCYDELFDGQSLSLLGIKAALSGSKAGTWGNELDWIGFDACLMASVEAAHSMRDCAGYMIASQAQEPSTGWNYAFLNGLENDVDAVATARRIIDGFYADNKDSTDMFTLSCVDLSRVWEVTNAMDRFFDTLYPVLSDETYSELARNRHQARGFGRAEYDEAADYDLVDLMALTKAYEGAGISGEQLKKALENAVVYSRSNEEGAYGLSIYHPCFNRTNFTMKWADRYQNAFSTMSTGYVQYVARFGKILTGKQLGNWTGLETRREETPDGEIRFSVTLSEEQAANYEHATLMVLSQVSTVNHGIDDSYYAVWETPYLELDENRTLSAVYPNRAIYVVDDLTGEQLAGPVNYRITESGKLKIFVTYSDDNGILDDDVLTVMYICEYDEKKGAIIVNSICGRDDITGDYSTRMTLDESFFRDSNYTGADFFIYNNMPSWKGDELLGYYDWKTDSSLVYSSVDLPRSWHFEVRGAEDEQEFTQVTFQITDTQNMTHSSSLSRVFPDLVEDYSPTVTEGGEDLTIAASAQYYKNSDTVFFEIQFLDTPMQIRSFETDYQSVYLNDSILINNARDFSNSGTLTLTFGNALTLGLTDIRSLDFDLIMQPGNDGEELHRHIRLELPEPIMLARSDVEPLAAGRSQDGLNWTLWDLYQRDDGAINLTFSVYNASSAPEKIGLDQAIVEGYCFACGFEEFDCEPGITSVFRLLLYSKYAFYDEALRVVATASEPMDAAGIKSIGDILVDYSSRNEYPYTSYQIHLTLNEEIPYSPVLPKGADQGVLKSTAIADTEEVRLLLSQYLTYRDSKFDRDAILLGFLIFNDSDDTHDYLFNGFSVDGLRVRNQTWDKLSHFELPPHTVRFCYLSIELPEGVSQAKAVSFDLYADEDYLLEAYVDLYGILR